MINPRSFFVFSGYAFFTAPLQISVPGGIRTHDLPLRSSALTSKHKKGQAFPYHIFALSPRLSPKIAN